MTKTKRIRCIKMLNDPQPILPGAEGDYEYTDDAGVIHVKWDDGRTLGLIEGVDKYEFIN